MCTTVKTDGHDDLYAYIVRDMLLIDDDVCLETYVKATAMLKAMCFLQWHCQSDVGEVSRCQMHSTNMYCVW